MVLSFILSLVFTFSVHAQRENLSHGEKDFGLYYGTQSPLSSFNHYSHRTQFFDDKANDIYFDSKISNELKYLESFLLDEFKLSLLCPDKSFMQKTPYISYLNRLVTISYLYEALNIYEATASQFDVKKTCQLNWKKVISSCRPKSNDMKFFLKQVEREVSQKSKVLVSFEKTTKLARRKWIDNFNSNRLKNLVQFRMKKSCHGYECKNLNSTSLKKNLGRICQEDTELLIRTCSEADHIFGNSRVPEAYFLLANSEALRGINADGYAKGCLRRFINQGKRFEKRYVALESIFPALFDKFQNASESVYAQGRLFPLGTLKEFLDKGLSDVFVTKKKKVIVAKKQTVIKKVIKKKVSTPKAKPIQKVVVQKVTVKPKPKKKVIPKSAFLIASGFRTKYELDKVKVEMNKFKYDYIFTLSKAELLKPKMELFSSMKSLKNMQRLDKLGSKVAPIPLKFLKYLIDYEMHQGLYNIVNVLGEKFFVKNDIDKFVKQTEFVKIKNDQTTDFQWQIFVIEHVKPKVKKKKIKSKKKKTRK